MNIQFVAHIDVTWLAASVLHKDREALWNEQYVIPLRGPEGLTPERWAADEPSMDYKALTDWPAAKNALAKVHKALPPTTLKVRGHAYIAQVLSGTGLPWVTDDTGYAKAHIRFMVPLVTNPGVFMASGGQWSHAEVGSLVMVNHRALCSIVNFSTVHRCISLVVDYRATE